MQLVPSVYDTKGPVESEFLVLVCLYPELELTEGTYKERIVLRIGLYSYRKLATALISYLLVAASHFSGPWFDHCRRHKTLTFSGNLSV
jgi:hypothetical protein